MPHSSITAVRNEQNHCGKNYIEAYSAKEGKVQIK
jgi:hypothetical protein